jgi:hypothetical protein
MLFLLQNVRSIIFFLVSKTLFRNSLNLGSTHHEMVLTILLVKSFEYQYLFVNGPMYLLPFSGGVFCHELYLYSN